MKGLIKTPLIIAVVFIVGRILLELAGAPGAITHALGVTWLNLLVPIYLGFRIASAGSSSPFKSLFMPVFLFALYTRLIVMVTYMLAYVLNWDAYRFSLEGNGGVGHDSALQGMIVIPAMNLVLSVVGLTVIGMILGSLTLLIRRRTVPA